MQDPGLKTTYTLAEAAKLLSCHKETLRRAIKNGELRAAKLGRGLRISRVDLEAFWSACGGGELFQKQLETQPAVEIVPATPEQKPVKKDVPEQLSLFSPLG